jgi:hypothetical protein
MRTAILFLLPVLLSPLGEPESGGSQSRVGSDCREWTECRRLALEAAERHEYETFHDLAWRAVQTGPRQDPALMYLLARAQVLSGRPHDALITIQRLAEMGVTTDAATNGEFERMRALPGWPAVEALVEGVRSSGSRPRVSAEDRSPAVATASEAAPVEEAVRISTPPFIASGLAYDAVSGRFVVGDLHGRKVIIVQDGADHAVNLVGAESAGFDEIRALEIDTRHGDLWVATATAEDERWSLHQLQLVSGRLLKVLPIDAALGPTKLVDLALSPLGTILAVDAAGKRLLELRPKETTLQPVLSLSIEQPTSLAVANDEVVYVAGAATLQRVDLRRRTAVPVSMPPGIEFATIERIRSYKGALLAVMGDGHGSRRVVRFDLSASGRAVTAATIIDRTIAATAGPVFTTISGDYLSYVVADAEPRTEFIVRRIRLR